MVRGMKPKPRLFRPREILISEHIDWPCQIKTRFCAENQGCQLGVSSAITWFFEQEEAGIVLEDDCVPHPDFFLTAVSF